MNNTEFYQLMATPFFLIAPSIVLIVLMALTMRAVINRERAMIPERRRDQDARVAYMNRWRNQTSA